MDGKLEVKEKKTRDDGREGILGPASACHHLEIEQQPLKSMISVPKLAMQCIFLSAPAEF